MTAEAGTADQISTFLETGIYRFGSSNAVFIDPVRVLNWSYTRFRLSPPAYYSRFFPSVSSAGEPKIAPDHPLKRKRKQKQKKIPTLNERERIADQRHQKAKPILTKAHESLLGAASLLEFLQNLRNDEISSSDYGDSVVASDEQCFFQLGRLWQAPLFEIVLNYYPQHKPSQGSSHVPHCQQRLFPLYNNLVVNETSNDAEIDFLGRKYVIPKESCFFMSDLEQIQCLIPPEPDRGYNLIVIDPPWENSSAYQKMKYPTLPNWHFLSIPVKRLAHTVGALVALWVTNKERLRTFVEKDLFPKWGVKYLTTHYWLKVKADGSLIGEIDLFHHRPYECLLLGYCDGEASSPGFLSSLKSIPDAQVLISVPGDYSRKPPIGVLLMEHMLGPKPARCIELFAREMLTGWTSWGNEPLHYQDSRYFIRSDK